MEKWKTRKNGLTKKPANEAAMSMEKYQNLPLVTTLIMKDSAILM